MLFRAALRGQGEYASSISREKEYWRATVISYPVQLRCFGNTRKNDQRHETVLD